jgi:hypothetical protein
MRNDRRTSTICGMTSTAQANVRICRLQDAVGRVEACPEERCPFWEPGGAVLEGRCAFEQLDVSQRPELASWLLRMRTTLDSARHPAEADDAWRLFHRLLNDGDGE